MNDRHAEPDLGYLLHRAARAFRTRLAEGLRDIGITPLQASVLIVLSSAGRATPRALASAVDTDAPTMSGVLQRLERDGWVNVARSATDGRSRIVDLTARAHAALPGLLRTAEAASRRASSALSPAERRQLVTLLLRLTEGAQ